MASLGQLLAVVFFPSSAHHPRDGDEFISLGFVARNQMIRGDHRLGAICAHLIVTAIVQQDHVAATDLFGDLAARLLRRAERSSRSRLRST